LFKSFLIWIKKKKIFTKLRKIKTKKKKVIPKWEFCHRLLTLVSELKNWISSIPQ